MANLNRLDTNKSLESLLDMDKSETAKKVVTPMQQMIPGDGLEYSQLSYSVIKNLKKDGVWIKKEAYYLLQDISGQALRGEVMGIIGPSGAGKSTFLDALAGRIASGSLEGSVSIDGKSVS